MDKFLARLFIGVLACVVVSACVGPSRVPPDSQTKPQTEQQLQQARERAAARQRQQAEEKERLAREEQSRLEHERQLKLERERIEAERKKVEEALGAEAVDTLCRAIGNKLGSVSIAECRHHGLQHAGFSTEGQSIAYRDYLPVEGREPLGKVLMLGGIHGDEFSSVSIVFKWLAKLDRFHSGLFHWRVVPTVNPDGLLRRKSQRQNSHGVDLNRNFPTADWSKDAHAYWINETKRNPRRNPGQSAASEIETQWIVDQIEAFQPDVIIALHAPYHLVDYDGPPTAPENLGGLYLRKLGVYPGSLGNYVGIDMNKPIVTVELKSAGIMPLQSEIDSMWNDLVGWLRTQLSQ